MLNIRASLLVALALLAGCPKRPAPGDVFVIVSGDPTLANVQMEQLPDDGLRVDARCRSERGLPMVTAVISGAELEGVSHVAAALTLEGKLDSACLRFGADEAHHALEDFYATHGGDPAYNGGDPRPH